MNSRLAEKEKDLEFLVSLRNEPGVAIYSNRGVVPSEILEKDFFHTPANSVYVVEEEGAKIGYVICHDRTADAEGRFYISVALVPTMRGHGYGPAMMKEAVSRCWEHGATEVYTDDVHANNQRSIRSMEKMGYEVLDRSGPRWKMIYRKKDER